MKITLLVLSAFLGLIALGGGAYLYFTPPTGTWLQVAETDVELAGCRAGQNYDAVYRLNNRSGGPMRVLGVSSTCGLEACFHANYADLPGPLPPGITEAHFPLTVHSVGDFRTQMYLWVDDHGTREIVLSVHGTAEPAPAKADEKGAKDP